MTQTDPSFCPDCGQALERRHVEDRERAFCPDCGQVVWVNPVPCAFVLVRDGDEALLVERAVPPGVGDWAVPGGHVERDEEPAVAAARELEEETGVAVDPADLTLSWSGLIGSPPGKTVTSIGYTVDRAATDGEPTAGSDAAACRFWSRPALRAADVPLRPYLAANLDALFGE